MYFGQFIFERTLNNVVQAFLMDSGSNISLAQSYRDPIVYTLDQLNFNILLFFAGLEIFRQLQHQTDSLSLRTGLIGIFFIVLSFSTQVINFYESMPYRWQLFGTLLLIFPASSMFTRLLRSRTEWGRVVAILIIIFYFFLGLTNTESNQDSPLYGESSTLSISPTSLDIAAATMLQRIALVQDLNVKTDFSLWYYLKFKPGGNKVGYWKNIQLDNYDGIFTIRNVYFKRFTIVGKSAIGLDLFQSNLAQFYDNGDVKLFDRVNNPSAGNK
jgi:hypothetical protein